jgi:hypothetical protein
MGKRKDSRRNLSKCHFIHHKTTRTALEVNPAPAVRRRKITDCARARPRITLTSVFTKVVINFQDEEIEETSRAHGSQNPIWPTVSSTLLVDRGGHVRSVADKESGWMVGATVKKEKKNWKILILAVAPVYDGNRQ